MLNYIYVRSINDEGDREEKKKKKEFPSGNDWVLYQNDSILRPELRVRQTSDRLYSFSTFVERYSVRLSGRDTVKW